MSSAQALERIQTTNSLDELENLRVSLLGKKGEITLALKSLGEASPEERKTKGAEINRLKTEVTEALEARKRALELATEAEKLATEKLDATLPARSWPQGNVHPITQVMDEIAAILGGMGFSVRTGPLIEDEEHNFNALNIPASHPARQMHDTFYVQDHASYLLRTHTSPVQIRTMRAEKPPIRIIAPGPTFRCDSDQTHTPMFHQVEGLLIDKNIHMGHLKGCVSEFLRRFFDMKDLPIRFRPSFFPFTEPSAEVDIGCARSKDSVKVGQGGDWLEVMGCGMVHPKVLENCNIDPNAWQGFAFGVGVERLAMLKYNIPDLRTFFESDVRWLNYYGFGAIA